MNSSPASSANAAPYALVLHGGAGNEPARLGEAERDEYRAALEAALRLGQAFLDQGGTSLDCVERVVRRLEDDPLFNAGRGAVLAFEGECELDAAIMDGRDRACGAVAAVRTVKNPVSLARLVMTRSEHVLLAGAGAEQFAEQMGVERGEPEYFRTAARAASWEKARRAREQDANPPDAPLGTVGCAALDRMGNLAAATSTGGTTLKRFGRVGDTPLVGAGTFADNATCAVSCTGRGEEFIRHVAAYDVSALIEYRGLTLAEAARRVVHEKLHPGDGGLIAVARDGSLAMEFITDGMFRAAADSHGRFEIGLGK
jgi:beta-aspartyl-peptidase (threonine type)